MSSVGETLTRLRDWSSGKPDAAVRVFGSVMRANPDAHDVDLGVDLDIPPWSGTTDGPGDVSRLESCTDLLALRRQLGSGPDGKASLDVFVRSGGRLFAPTDDGYWWKPAYDQTIWAKIQSRGILLSSVTWTSRSP